MPAKMQGYHPQHVNKYSSPLVHLQYSQDATVPAVCSRFRELCRRTTTCSPCTSLVSKELGFKLPIQTKQGEPDRDCKNNLGFVEKNMVRAEIGDAQE